MKKILFLVSIILVTLVLFSFSGCVKDTITRTYTYTIYEPVYKTSAEVRANIKSNTPVPLVNPGKIYIRGSYLFLNEVNKGIHVIDNSNPSTPKNVAFIDIPGNVDLAVKGNTLYADLYTDLVSIDITNPLNVQVKSVVENVFPHRYYGGYFMHDSTKIIARWLVRDTIVTEKLDVRNERVNGGGIIMFAADANGGKSGSGAPGMGGSMARFTIVANNLYTVGNNDLNVFNIAGTTPAHINKQHIGWSIETIYPFKNKLFIGSSNGMFIYDITNASSPALQGQFSHVRSCDPVVADDTHAYVTLRSGSLCMGFTNQLEVLDITNLTAPNLVKTYPMTNPHGLSKDGNLLFICDGKDGVKVYNATNPANLQLIKTISGMTSYDVIAYNNIAMVVAQDGLYQYNYSSPANIELISKISLSK
jgi:hypothetical protein